MKVLLLKDVYKLGRAGDVKRVADGYGRNYLLPHGLATLATPGALKEVEHIRTQAATTRAALNQEMGGVAKRLTGLMLAFPVKAGETGKLYGSITPQMIAQAIKDKLGVEIDRHQIDTQPLRMLGEHTVHIRLTMDLVPEISVVVHREGETPEMAIAEQAAAEQAAAEAEAAAEAAAEAEAEAAAEEAAETAGEEA